MENNEKLIAGIILIVLAILIVILSPLVFIWAINTLFPLVIPYTFTTWCAAFIVICLFGKSAVSLKK